MPAPPQPYDPIGYIGWAKQSTGLGVQGTPQAPATFVAFDQESIAPNPRTTFYPNGSSQADAYSVVNGVDWGGTFHFPFTSNTGAAALYGVMGGTDTKSGVADPYTHALSFANDVPWHSFERAIAEQSYIQRIQDGKFDSLIIEGKSEDLVWCTAGIMACQAADQGMAATITYDADPVFMFRDTSFVFNGVSALLTVLRFKLTIKRNLRSKQTNHAYPDYLRPGRRSVEVELDVIWEGTNAPAWWRNVVYGAAGNSSGAAKVPFSGSTTITIDPNATPDHQAAFVIPDLRQITAKAPLDPQIRDLQALTITGKAQRPSSGADEIQPTIKNLTSTAYST